MQKYEEAYHKLFTAVSGTIELMEDLIPDMQEEDPSRKQLEIQVKYLKMTQQFTEEIIISD